MVLSECNIGENVKINICGNITVARILKKGRNSNSGLNHKKILQSIYYNSKDRDIQVKPVGARARFISCNTDVIEIIK